MTINNINNNKSIMMNKFSDLKILKPITTFGWQSYYKGR